MNRKVFLLIVFLFGCQAFVSISSTQSVPNENLFIFNSGYETLSQEGNYTVQDDWNFVDEERTIENETCEVFFPEEMNITLWYYVDWTEYDYTPDSEGWYNYYGWAFLLEEDPIYGTETSPEDGYVDFEPLEVVNASLYADYPAGQIQEWQYWWEYDIYNEDDDWIGTYWAYDWEIIVYDSLEGVGDINTMDYWITYTIYEDSSFEIQTEGEWIEVATEIDEYYYYESEGEYSSWYEYSSDIKGYEVSIRHNTMEFEYLAPVESTVDFIDYEYCYEEYDWYYSWETTVTATENMTINGIDFIPGDEIPNSCLPTWLQDESEGEFGSFSTTYSCEGTFESESTLQSHFHAYQTQTDPESYVIWTNQEKGIMLAYNETTITKGIDFDYDGHNHELVYTDSVLYRGYPELYSEDSEYYYSWDEDLQGYISSPYINKSWDYNTVGVDEYDINWVDPHYEYTVEFNVSEPLIVDDTVTFDWSIKYLNFPIWWVSTDYATGYVEDFIQTDFVYSYSMFVNLSSGESTLASEFLIGSMNEGDINFIGLGLATVQSTEFLTTSTLDNKFSHIDPVDTTDLTFTIDDSMFAGIDFSGMKSNYTLSSSSSTSVEKASIKEISIIFESGNSNSTLSTQTSDKVGTFLANNFVNESFEYEYESTQLFTSYPEWSGNQITHDPTYSAVAAVAAISATDDDKSTVETSNNELPTSNETINTEGIVPSFEFNISIVIGCILAIRKRQR